MKYLAFLVVLLALFSCGGDARDGKTSSAYKEGEVIVKFKPGVEESERYGAHAGIGALRVKGIGPRGLERIALPANLPVEEAVKVYEGNPDVEYAEPNYIVKAATIPNDPSFVHQWDLQNTGQTVNGRQGAVDADIDATEAWDIRTESDVIIAVIDTGIDLNHPEFAGNLVGGFDFIDNDTVPNDLNGHGSHIAGIIAAAGNNQQGITGVNWRAKLMPLKVLNQNGEGTEADVIEAVSFAGAHNAKVVNMSFSFRTSDPSQGRPLYDTMQGLPNIIFVAAAGNAGNSIESVRENPASFDLPNIISVASTNQNDALSSFSNYGTVSVDVAAPGENITSTTPSFVAGISYSGLYRTIYLSYGFECITGFNVQDETMRRALAFMEVVPGDPLLLVDDDSGGTSESYFARSIQSLGHTFNTYTVPIQGDGPDFAGLSAHKLVIWLTGSDFQNTLTAADQSNLQSYLDGGGRLFLSGQDIGLDISSDSFYQNYLHAFYVTDDALAEIFTGAGPFGGLSVNVPRVCNAGTSGAYRVLADAISPAGSATAFYVDYANAYQFLQGTSMSTAVVSGIAALAATHFSSFNAVQVKETILNNVEQTPSLTGKILTGGRVNAFRTLSAPLPPSGLTAVLGEGNVVVLTWVDNSADESGFQLERKEADGTFLKVADIAAGAQNFTDTGLTAGRTFIYRIRAFNTIAVSPYSNEASVTIPKARSGRGGGGGGGGCALGPGRDGAAVIDLFVLLFPLAAVIAWRRLRKI